MIKNDLWKIGDTDFEEYDVGKWFHQWTLGQDDMK